MLGSYSKVERYSLHRLKGDTHILIIQIKSYIQQCIKIERQGIVWNTYRTPLHFPSITGPFYKSQEPYKELPCPACKMDNFNFPE